VQGQREVFGWLRCRENIFQETLSPFDNGKGISEHTLFHVSELFRVDKIVWSVSLLYLAQLVNYAQLHLELVGINHSLIEILWNFFFSH